MQTETYLRLSWTAFKWIAKGRPMPMPDFLKQAVVRRYGKEHGLRTLVETGTYLGDMIEAVRGDFDRVYSIEIDRALHERATERFRADPRVEILLGDSGKVLASLTSRIREPALFWLDGHFSSGITGKGDLNTPILAELDHLLRTRSQADVILVDDARYFTGKDDYPTLQELGRFVHERRPGAAIETHGDIVRITRLG